MSVIDSRNYTGYTRIFLENHGTGPWNCEYCGEQVIEIGQGSTQEHVHHRDGNHYNDDVDNLTMMHSACHTRHHKIGKPSSMSGRQHSAEARVKMSIARKGKPQSSTGMLGKHHSAETKAKMSAAQKGKPRWSPEQREQIAARLRGRKLSDEHKENIRKGHARRSKEERVANAKKANAARQAKYGKKNDD